VRPSIYGNVFLKLFLVPLSWAHPVEEFSLVSLKPSNSEYKTVEMELRKTVKAEIKEVVHFSYSGH